MGTSIFSGDQDLNGSGGGCTGVVSGILALITTGFGLGGVGIIRISSFLGSGGGGGGIWISSRTGFGGGTGGGALATGRLEK